MKLILILLPLLYVVAATARSTLFPSGEEVSEITLASAAVYPVHGKNNFMFCGDPTDYILNFTNLDVTPHAPGPAGVLLGFAVSGIFKEDIDASAPVRITIGFNGATYKVTELEYCEYIGIAFDLKCPPTKGPMSTKGQMTIPAAAPGVWTLLAESWMHGTYITCVQTSVTV